MGLLKRICKAYRRVFQCPPCSDSESVQDTSFEETMPGAIPLRKQVRRSAPPGHEHVHTTELVPSNVLPFHNGDGRHTEGSMPTLRLKTPLRSATPSRKPPLNLGKPLPSYNKANPNERPSTPSGPGRISSISENPEDDGPRREAAPPVTRNSRLERLNVSSILPSALDARERSRPFVDERGTIRYASSTPSSGSLRGTPSQRPPSTELRRPGPNRPTSLRRPRLKRAISLNASRTAGGDFSPTHRRTASVSMSSSPIPLPSQGLQDHTSVGEARFMQSTLSSRKRNTFSVAIGPAERKDMQAWTQHEEDADSGEGPSRRRASRVFTRNPDPREDSSSGRASRLSIRDPNPEEGSNRERTPVPGNKRLSRSDPDPGEGSSRGGSYLFENKRFYTGTPDPEEDSSYGNALGNENWPLPTQPSDPEEGSSSRDGPANEGWPLTTHNPDLEEGPSGTGAIDKGKAPVRPNESSTPVRGGGSLRSRRATSSTLSEPTIAEEESELPEEPAPEEEPITAEEPAITEANAASEGTLASATNTTPAENLSDSAGLASSKSRPASSLGTRGGSEESLQAKLKTMLFPDTVLAATCVAMQRRFSHPRHASRYVDRCRAGYHDSLVKANPLPITRFGASAYVERCYPGHSLTMATKRCLPTTKDHALHQCSDFSQDKQNEAIVPQDHNTLNTEHHLGSKCASIEHLKQNKCAGCSRYASAPILAHVNRLEKVRHLASKSSNHGLSFRGLGLRTSGDRAYSTFNYGQGTMTNTSPFRFFSKSGTVKPPSPALGQLFDQYRDEPENEKDKISIKGTMSYLQALGVSLDEPAMLAVSTTVKSPTMGEITRDDFISGWDTRRADTIAKQKSAVQEMRKQLAGASDPDFFRTVYKHSHLLARQPGQRAVMLEAAGEFWRMLFGPGGLQWKDKNDDWLELWIDFLDQEWKKSVSNDLWNQTLSFANKTLEDGTLSWWSEESAWPGVIDEFVAWMKKRREEGEPMDTA